MNKNISIQDVSFCKKTIFWGQYGPTCWFNSLLMVILYSQRSRNVVLQESKNWDTKIELFRLLKHVLKYKYIKSKNPEKDYKFFDIMKPEIILDMFHNINKKYLPEKVQSLGFIPTLYITKMYKILNVKSLQFEMVGKSLYYYKYNHVKTPRYNNNRLAFNIKSKSKEYINKKLRDNIAPPIIIITIGHEDDDNKKGYMYMPQYKIPINDNNKDLLTNNDTIMYNGYEYELDSIVLSNYNINIKNIGHTIAGISCDNDRYVFNGWTRYSTDPAFASEKHRNMQKIPCELMKYNWEAKKNNDFCINTSKCSLTPSKIKDKKAIHCFSFNKGERSLIYVKKEYNIINTTKDIPDYVSYDKNSIKHVEKKECPDGKIINPLTGRCIKIKTAIDKNLVKPTKIKKDCPVGKIINPLTGRCIKIKNTVDKNLVKPTKTKNECPDGKIINPLTGRCIKIKNVVNKNK